jgi:phosphoglycerate dehydrogenase-like enzyme
MTSPRVHIYFRIGDGASYARMEKRGARLSFDEGTAARVDPFDLRLPADSVVAVGVCNRIIRIPRAALAEPPNLRVVATYTVGYDNVDVEAATELGVLVVNSPVESNWAGVAEGTMATMLAILKRVRERDRHVRSGGWRDHALAGTYVGARQTDGYPGITIGIIGLGRIGSRLADLLAPWHVRLIGYDPYVDDSKFVLHGVRAVGLDELLREADVVSIHCNLTAETTHIIDEAALEKMKPSAVLMNTARGPNVDVRALHRALESGRIAAAALDVLPEEPPPRDMPLFGLGDRILLSPHMVAYNHGSALEPAVPVVEDAVLKALRGEVPRYVVNPEALPKWRSRFGGSSLLPVEEGPEQVSLRAAP